MISVSEMREEEARAVAMGIEERIMMENAGANAAAAADSLIALKWKTVLVFCGTGNNAGDGLVFARHASIKGARVLLYFVKGTEPLKPLASGQLSILMKMKAAGCRLDVVKEIAQGITADILVDAMLGTGMKGEPGPEYARAIEAFNSMGGTKIALDCPSGIDADTGACAGACVRPDFTITFHDAKRGMAKENSGKIITAGIGIPRLHA